MKGFVVGSPSSALLSEIYIFNLLCELSQIENFRLVLCFFSSTRLKISVNVSIFYDFYFKYLNVKKN